MNKTSVGIVATELFRRNVLSVAVVLAGAGALMTLIASPASAQPRLTSGQVEEMIVTAQKVEESAQAVPIAITAISGVALDELGLKNAEQLGAQVPGLITTSYSGGGTVSVFSVRGVSQNDFAEHQEGPVAIYVDGVYIPSTSAAGAAMFDMKRVEVLKGPQGTLFGRNATGGLIHMIGNKPTEEAEGFADLTVGHYDQVTFEGAYGGPITKDLLGRVSVLTDRADGYFKNLNPDGQDGRARENYNARAALRYLPSDSATFDFVARYAKSPTNPDGVYDARPSDGTTRGTPSSAWSFLNLADDSEPNEGYILHMGQLGKESYSFEMTGEIEFGAFTITAITAYGNNQKQYAETESNEGILPDVSGLPAAIPQYVYSTEIDQNQFSQELRINGDMDRFRYQAGFYYLNIDGTYNITSDFPFFGGRAVVDYGMETESWSVFGQMEYDLTESLTAVVGARYVTDKKDYANNSKCANLRPSGNNLSGFPTCSFFTSGDPANPFILDWPGTYEDSIDDDLTAFTFKLNYQTSEDVLLYAGYSRGVKAGGFSAPLDGFIYVSDLEFEPEVLDSYEAGIKSSFWDNRAQLNASLFYYDYEDYQAFVYNGISSRIDNAKAEMTGGELELVLTPAEGWYFSAGVAVLDSEVSEVGGLNGNSATYFPEQDMPLAPELTYNMVLKKSWELSNGGYVDLQWDGNYVDDQEFSANGTPTTKIDSYELWNTRLTYGAPDSKWKVSAFLKNVFDEEYQIYAFDLSRSFGVSLEVYGPPRWWGAEVRYNF